MSEVKVQALERQLSLIGYIENDKFCFYQGSKPAGVELIVLRIGFSVTDLLKIATPIEVLEGEEAEQILRPKNMKAKAKKERKMVEGLSLI